MRKNMELKYDVEIPKRIDNKNDEIRRLILEFINSGSQWTIVNKKDTKRERLRRNHLLKSQFFFVGSQVSI